MRWIHHFLLGGRYPTQRGMFALCVACVPCTREAPGYRLAPALWTAFSSMKETVASPIQ